MSLPAPDPRIRLKEDKGWFAAGASFARALALLSDGAFKLFAWLCLQARCDSGLMEASQHELARALGKSKRAIGRWTAELEAKGLCHIEPGRNQHERTRFRIQDAFWPYYRSAVTAQRSDRKDQKAPVTDYVAQV